MRAQAATSAICRSVSAQADRPARSRTIRSLTIRRYLTCREFLLELGDLLLELLNPFLERGQRAEHDRRLSPLGVIERGNPGDEAARLDRLEHGALCTHLDPPTH